MGEKIPARLRKKADLLARRYVFFAIIRQVIYAQGAKQYHNVVPGEIYHFNTDKAVKSRAGVLVYDEWKKAMNLSNSAIHEIERLEAKHPLLGKYFDTMVDKWNSFFETKNGAREIQRYFSETRFHIISTEFFTRPLRHDETRERLLKAIPNASQREANALWKHIEALHPGITKRLAQKAQHNPRVVKPRKPARKSKKQVHPR